MRSRAGPITGRKNATEISVAEMKIFTYEHSNPRDRDEIIPTK